MNASPSSPPTMCTPPSGIDRPAKNTRTSIELADHGKFCRRMIQLIISDLCWLFVLAGNTNPKELVSETEQEDKFMVQSQSDG